MKTQLLAATFATLSLTTAAFAEGLAEHTFLLTWADDNCEGFTYAEDMLRHARMDVLSAGEAEVKAIEGQVIGGLHAIHDGNMAEICETVVFLIENPEEEEG